ncbi:hypothetical protein FIBSPDRAFT_239205 [Athelia psychrophila]|uniref:Uncharacterized protein n=1 Tax=Athelia psychrophila TaxID=1759441 RepID=A0A165YE95_9AGAM|nr:hypothetical protein FIBSPDRAFT_239205 [Fibularhizoctonia sp. CBS 109695]
MRTQFTVLALLRDPRNAAEYLNSTGTCNPTTRPAADVLIGLPDGRFQPKAPITSSGFQHPLAAAVSHFISSFLPSAITETKQTFTRLWQQRGCRSMLAPSVVLLLVLTGIAEAAMAIGHGMHALAFALI